MTTFILHPFAPFPSHTSITRSKPFPFYRYHFLSSSPRSKNLTFSSCCAKNRRENLNGKDFDLDLIKEDLESLEDGADDFEKREDEKDIDMDLLQVLNDDGEDEDSSIRKEKNKDYDKDPEFAEIIGGFLDDPQKAQSKMEGRLRRKRNKILHTKTGSGIPMNVSVNKFDFSNSFIWFEFYNTLLPKDISLICDTIRAWHIIGRLGGCNSMNMQLSQSPMEKRPSYDYIQGANVTPTTFYNIGDLEVQDNLARIWVDIGTSEPVLLDVLINALTQISSDFVGIKQVMIGGDEFENWKENLKSEASGFSVHKI
ncbi:hypothetical protein Lal_00028905 [Lupinus albus]|uniref:Uncharacterized protein n=1 Tax=Lupinus albus TaxID=3870 RepID=A0A6A5NCD3_LUPAL|nr:hypothetical protein Lalb_Chr19g0132441 [Lupinus albus]KAF1885016.1 hypothetical protein Lal_00028905 [Lupinus albus]